MNLKLQNKYGFVLCLERTFRIDVAWNTFMLNPKASKFELAYQQVGLYGCGASVHQPTSLSLGMRVRSPI